MVVVATERVVVAVTVKVVKEGVADIPMVLVLLMTMLVPAVRREPMSE